jgi:GT2 family glycosyltransferase
VSSPSGTPTVHAVVLTWNAVDLAEQCIRSLDRLDEPHPRVIVVDNGSTDGTEERIRAAYPLVTVEQTGRNLGFAGGMNVGIRRALRDGARYVWLLNNDTLPEPGALGALVAEAERHPSIGIAGSLLLESGPERRVQAWGGGSIGRWLGLTELWTTPHGARPPDYITGASMLLRRELLDDVGLLDEGFFVYFDDTDLSLRARRCGWRLAVAADSVVVHQGGATLGTPDRPRSEEMDRHLVRSAGRFLARYLGWRLAVAAPVRLVSLIRRRLQLGQARRVPSLVREYLTGLVSGLRDRPRCAGRR